MGFLLCDIFPNCSLVEPYRAHVLSLTPEMPITEFVFQIRMLVENHQTTLAFQIPHELRHAVLRWYTYEHVDVVRHEMTFDYLDSLVTAELPQYLADTFLVLTVYCLAAIFRREYYMIFTEPFCMAQRVSDICHLLSSLALRNRLEQPIVHLRGKFFLL